MRILRGVRRASNKTAAIVGELMSAWELFRNDERSKLRLLWFILAIGPEVVFLMNGTGFAIGGTASTYSLRPYRILLETFPHNLHVHGVILLVLSVSSLITVGMLLRDCTRKTWNLSRIPLVMSLTYSFWCCWCFAGAWWVNHNYTATMWWYLLAAVMSGAAASVSPSLDGERQRNVAE